MQIVTTGNASGTPLHESVSKGLRAVSFVAFICVVMIHSKAMPTALAESSFVYKCLFTKWTAWAVPWFFFLSGYFVGRDFERIASFDALGAFLKKKVRTLAVPYILWTVVLALFAVPLILLANLRAGRMLLFNTPFADGVLSWQSFLGFFGIDRFNGPAMAGHLWFLRTLIIMMAVSPIVLFIKKCLNKFSPIVMWFLGAISIVSCLHDGYYQWCMPIGYFLIGMACDIPKLRDTINANRNVWGKSMVVIGGGLVALCVCEEFARGIFRLNVIGGVRVILCMILMLILGLMFGERTYRPFMKNTFWGYCVHVVFTTYICVTLKEINKESYVFGWGASLISVACAVVLSLVSYQILYRRLPRITKVLCGGR